MRRTRRELLALLAALVYAQPDGEPRIVPDQLVEIRGTIEKVAAGTARGMPMLEVVEGERRWRVWLGALRYLIENDFNPRAGQRVVIRAFRVSPQQDEVWAAAVTLVGSKRTLRLRDEFGRPLWRRGPGPGWRGRKAGKTF
ncbi:MAG: hypothetical protein RMI94_11010 [Bryobacterales bacterium]|nr:hypothetical protein [Bryobacteraceae bacterium]MDW8131069.1 hypothetical protein [Bryobacterales bacterium]